MTDGAAAEFVESPDVGVDARLRRWVTGAAGIAGAALLLYLAFRNVNPGEAFALLAGLGATAPLLLVPSVIAVGLEMVSWRAAFAKMGFTAPLLGLYRVRVVSDSLGAVLPLGMVWADAVKPPLLARHCSLSTPASLAGIAARKYLLVLSQAGYLLCGFVLGRAALEDGSEKLTGQAALAWVTVLLSIALVGVAEVTALTLRGGRALSTLLGLLSRVPSRALRQRLERFRVQAAHTDGTAAAFFGLPRATLGLLALPCWGGWLLEATETWVMLRALGSTLAFGDAIGVEALVVLARHLLVVVPGGLGIQELGYATLLGALGTDASTCAAFALLKRSKELVWVMLGYALLVQFGHPRERLGIDPRSLQTGHASLP